MRPGAAEHLLPEYLSRSVPGLSCSQSGQARHAHRRCSAGGGLNLRADLRQLPSPVIVILRSHPASLHRPRSRFSSMPQARAERDLPRQQPMPKRSSAPATAWLTGQRGHAGYRSSSVTSQPCHHEESCYGRTCPAAPRILRLTRRTPDRSDDRSQGMPADRNMTRKERPGRTRTEPPFCIYRDEYRLQGFGSTD
jgi:hypothetical protein